ncbi:HD domain-containing phosphohydrolase [Candidatus Omnitrophota bacterium]
MFIAIATVLGLLIGFIIAQHFYQRKTKPVKPETPPAKGGLDDRTWHQQETEFMFMLNEQISLTFDRDKVAKYIVEGVHKFLYVRKTVLLLLDKETQQFKIASALGLEQELIENFVLKNGEGISGHVFSGKKPLMINELAQEPYLKGLNKEDYLQKSFISVPLVFKNESLGVLHVCDRIFSENDFEFMRNIAKVGAIAFNNALLRKQIQDDYLKTIVTLAAAIDARDHYTKWHSENVARYSVAIAQEMKLSTDQSEVLRRAALLHDIGKIGIRDDILLKTSRLTPKESEQIRLHPEKGEQIVKALSFLKDISTFIRHHHENYDGSGYPDGISGKKIELEAKILAVADTFDAMTSDRPYRKALALDQAIQQLKQNRDTQLDPIVVDYFLKALESSPSIITSPDQKA